jgi:N-acetylmuramic acid 6-phosphate etherase
VVPAHVGVDDPTRWSCCCERCAERFGAPLPSELTPEVQAFREASVADFLREVVGHVAERGGRNTVCLLPATEGAQGLADWDTVAALPGLTTLATDPYWKHWDEPAGAFVRRFARLLRETCERHGVGAQLWLPSFGLTRDDIPDLQAAIAAAREEGIDDLWTWAYEAAAHMTSLATPDSPGVWEAVSDALTLRPQQPTEASRFDELERRTTRGLVELVNAEDATVARAVAEAADELAAAIEAIIERLARGGRLVYVGAGTSGRLAALDAAECGPTFGCRPGEVVAVVAGGSEDAEDDGARGGDDVRALRLGPNDALVAVSASGSTPYTLGGLEAARDAGALCIAVVCSRGSPLARAAAHEVAVVVGPELIAGSTRLKAGTAQKLVLNTISTVTMIRLGRTFAGLMVGVAPRNAKLRERARRNVVLASGAAEEDVDAALAAAGGDARVALVSLLAGVDPSTARERLEGAKGSVRLALEGPDR